MYQAIAHDSHYPKYLQILIYIILSLSDTQKIKYPARITGPIHRIMRVSV